MIKTVATQIMLGGCLLFLSACGLFAPNPDQMPDWILGESSSYPKADYVSSIGAASALFEAKNRAKAGITNYFAISVKETIKYSDSAEFEWIKHQVPQKRQELEKSIVDNMTQSLGEIQLVKEWHDKKKGIYYVLGVIERDNLIDKLKVEIENLDNITNKAIKLSNTDESQLRRFKMASRAIKAQRKRSLLQVQLMVMSNDKKGLPYRWAIRDLEPHRRNLIPKVKVHTTSRGAFQFETKMAIEKTLKAEGFNTTRRGQLKIASAMTIKNLGQQGGWHWLEGQLNLKILENNHRVIGEKTWLLKISASGEKAAEARLLGKAKEVIIYELPDLLLDYVS